MNTKNLICLFGILLISGCMIKQNTTGSLSFHTETMATDNLDILVDDLPVIQQGQNLYPLTANTRTPLTIKIGEDAQEISVTKLSSDTTIPLTVHHSDQTVSYTLHTLPKNFPEITLSQDSKIPSGQILFSVHGLSSYAIIYDTSGKVVYYRGNNKPQFSMFHLQRWTLPDGQTRYSVHEREELSDNKSFFNGSHLVLDERFRPVDRVRILPTSTHPALLAEEHEFIMLDKDHYIVLGYNPYTVKTEDGESIKVYSGIIQEQKDGRVIMDWDARNYPELLSACIEKCPALNKQHNDFMHVNSIHIDPNDNNLIVSMASSYGIIKIHRKTGEILWHLGGKNDEFGLADYQRFFRQHDVQMTKGGDLIIFDNASTNLSPAEQDFYHKKNISNPARILVLKLDEKNKKITSFKEIPLNFYAKYMGSAQQLPKGRWFVGCGSSTACTAKMIDESGAELFKINGIPNHQIFRAYYIPTDS